MFLVVLSQTSLPLSPESWSLQSQLGVDLGRDSGIWVFLRSGQWQEGPSQSLKDRSRGRPEQTSHLSEALLSLSASMSPLKKKKKNNLNSLIIQVEDYKVSASTRLAHTPGAPIMHPHWMHPPRLSGLWPWACHLHLEWPSRNMA